MASVRPDDLTGSEDAPPIASAARAGVPLLIVAAVVLVGLVAAAILLGAAPPAQQAALAAARAEAVALTTIGYKTTDSDLDRVLAGATGALRTQFAAEKGQLPATLAKTKSESRGAVLSSALSSLRGSRAQVLVALDATVSGTDTAKTGVLKHYRMVITLALVGGKWLASDVAFAGVPQ
jgi:Mce-associated membrane protein